MSIQLCFEDVPLFFSLQMKKKISKFEQSARGQLPLSNLSKVASYSLGKRKTPPPNKSVGEESEGGKGKKEGRVR